MSAQDLVEAVRLAPSSSSGYWKLGKAILRSHSDCLPPLRLGRGADQPRTVVQSIFKAAAALDPAMVVNPLQFPCSRNSCIRSSPDTVQLRTARHHEALPSTASRGSLPSCHGVDAWLNGAWACETEVLKRITESLQHRSFVHIRLRQKLQPRNLSR